MPSWWGKSSSKDGKKKTSKENFFHALHRFITTSDQKELTRSGCSRRRCSEKGFLSRAVSRSASPSNNVSRCQSFSDRLLAQPLPLPQSQLPGITRSPSEINASRPVSEKRRKPPLLLPLPTPDRSPIRPYAADIDTDLATASGSSNCSIDSDDPTDSQLPSPAGNDLENSNKITAINKSSLPSKDHVCATPRGSRDTTKSTKPPFNNHTSISPRHGLSVTPNIQSSWHGAVASAPDSSMSSPSRSPMIPFCLEQIPSSAFWGTKALPDVTFLGSGQCSSPGSGQTSGHNSMGGDMLGQLFWQHSRASPECSPIPSPRMTSPGPSSRIHSGAVTPLHPRAGGTAPESPTGRIDEGKKQSHRLPLPPLTISNTSPFASSISSCSTPISRSPGRTENPTSPGPRWKKGKLIGRGTFGHVYVGFNSESGEMCAMKEVTLFSDDAKSRESAKQLGQEVALLSRLRHPNIVQYYGSETVDDKLYIYLEYVSGGSIHKLLQEYGRFGESAIRSYTNQILSGLAYLHAKNTVHRDIKGANILVDPKGCIKLADFGMAKHISGQSCPLSFKGSPYWMAPEVIKNMNGCNLAVDIWSLGCTVLEMATSKPPWSQYEGIAAMFKIGNSKELPAIPDSLSDEGKDFVRQCLQREPSNRPTAAELLHHPFLRNLASMERPLPISYSLETSGGQPQVFQGRAHTRNLPSLDMEGLTIQSLRAAKAISKSSDGSWRNVSCPVSPIGSPLLHSRSPQQINGRISPSPISSPRTTSGSSTPLTGGNGALLYKQQRQSSHINKDQGDMLRITNSLHINGLVHHDSNHDPPCGKEAGSPVFRELLSSENEIGLSLTRLGNVYDGQSVLSDQVSQQLRDHMKLKQSLSAIPEALNLGRRNVT